MLPWKNAIRLVLVVGATTSYPVRIWAGQRSEPHGVARQTWFAAREGCKFVGPKP